MLLELRVRDRRRSAPSRSSRKLVRDRDLAAITLTNPEREIFAGSGVTKLDLALYYARVGDWLLPELLRRPVTMFRCPTGEAKDCFYQRHAFAGLPPGVETIDLADEEGRAAFIAVTEPRGFLALAQFGAIEFHLWGCHIDDPEHPDRLVMDLDPDEELPWARVCDGAEILRERLKALGFAPFLRTTGGKGLHLVVALAGGHDWPLVKGFAEALAQAMAADAPEPFHRRLVEGAAQRPHLPRLSAQRPRRERGRLLFPARPARLSGRRRRSPGRSCASCRAATLSTVLTSSSGLETLAADPWDELESSRRQDHAEDAA